MKDAARQSPPWRHLQHDAACLVRETWRELKQHAGVYLLLPLFGILLATFLFPLDPAISHYLATGGRIQFLYEFAGEFSSAGDFVEGTAVLALLIWLLGGLARQRDWQRVALAVLLAATLAGLLTNIPRILAGRARPNTDLADGFHGPSASYDFQSFPSCHAATAMGTATSLAAAFPALAPAALLVGGAVALCRVYVNAHYISDSLVGGLIGVLCGLAVGRALGRLRAAEPAA